MILPASINDVPLDFDTLQPYGCFIDSAAIIVLSQHDRARDAALNAMRFFAHESCGQCTPCREGMGWIERILDKVLAAGTREITADFVAELLGVVER